MKQPFEVLAPIVLILTFAACSRDSTTAPNAAETLAMNGAGRVNGAAGQMPAYYDGELFTVNMKELSDDAAERLEKNPTLAEIYAYNDLEDEQDFFPIIDATQGDNFSPLWEQFLIVFNSGTPHQFVSEEEVEAAVDSGEITLIETEEIYRCSVVGKK